VEIEGEKKGPEMLKRAVIHVPSAKKNPSGKSLTSVPNKSTAVRLKPEQDSIEGQGECKTF
jgi:hypothetical protein